MPDIEDDFDDDYKLRKKVDRIDRRVDDLRVRVKEDDALKLVETVFDEKTRLILFSFITKEIIDSIDGAISTGKEANVYYAPSRDGAVAVKIFRIDAPSFRKMRSYVEGDYRFKKIQNRRSGFIELWAKKEFKNLKRMQKHGVPVPTPLAVERNILVMEFLGANDSVLPLLKESSIKSPNKLYKRIMEDVRTVYRDAQLIHGDLSEYNILYNEEDESYYFIDVSQAVIQSHPKANIFLLRDLNNLNAFFTSLGGKVIELDRLFKWVTGFDVPEIDLLTFLD